MGRARDAHGMPSSLVPTLSYTAKVVPRWKTTLSRAMTASVRAAENAQERRLPHLPLPTNDPWYESHEALDTIQPGTLLDQREIDFGGRFAFGLWGPPGEPTVAPLRYRGVDCRSGGTPDDWECKQRSANIGQPSVRRWQRRCTHGGPLGCEHR